MFRRIVMFFGQCFWMCGARGENNGDEFVIVLVVVPVSESKFTLARDVKQQLSVFGCLRARQEWVILVNDFVLHTRRDHTLRILKLEFADYDLGMPLIRFPFHTTWSPGDDSV